MMAHRYEDAFVFTALLTNCKRFGNWAVQRCLEAASTAEERRKIVSCMRYVGPFDVTPSMAYTLKQGTRGRACNELLRVPRSTKSPRLRGRHSFIDCLRTSTWRSCADSRQ